MCERKNQPFFEDLNSKSDADNVVKKFDCKPNMVENYEQKWLKKNDEQQSLLTKVDKKLFGNKTSFWPKHG